MGEHRELGARFEIEAGWEIVAGYPDEPPIVSSPIVIAEITPRAKVDVRGAAVPVSGLEGAVVVASIASDWALVFGGPGDERELLPSLEAAAGNGAMVTDATHLFAGFALVGSELDALLARLTAFDSSSLPVGAAAGAPILDVPAILLRRDTALPVIEAYVGIEFARFAWSGIFQTATELGGAPVGWSSLRAAGWS